MKTYADTGRTAIFSDGHSERIFETYSETGVFAGVRYEVTESELPANAIVDGESESERQARLSALPLGCDERVR